MLEGCAIATLETTGNHDIYGPLADMSDMS